MSKPRRRTVVIGSVAAVAAAITITAINMSSASQPGDSAGLTALSGNTISWDSPGKSLTINDSSGVKSGGAWSPDGSRFAYVANDNDVHTVRWEDGSDIASPTFQEPQASSHPTWTADGSYIVFSEGGQLEMAPSDGFSLSSPVLLPAGTYADPDGGPAQDPNNFVGAIVFTQTDASGGPEVEYFTADQMFSGQPISPTSVTAGTQPALSPDGTRVAFVKAGGQIWTTDLQGGTPVQVTSDAG